MKKLEFRMYRDNGGANDVEYAVGTLQCEEKHVAVVTNKMAAGMRGNWKLDFEEVKRGRPAATKPPEKEEETQNGEV